MGNSKGRDNVKKRASRHKKTMRLAAAKQGDAQPAAGHPGPAGAVTTVGAPPRSAS